MPLPETLVHNLEGEDLYALEEAVEKFLKAHDERYHGGHCQHHIQVLSSPIVISPEGRYQMLLIYRTDDDSLTPT